MNMPEWLNNPALLAGIAGAAGLAAGYAAGRLTARKSCPANGRQQGRTDQRPRMDRRRDIPERPAQPPRPGPDGWEIYVGNLSYDLTSEQLRAEFDPFGKVNSARIITYGINNRSKGFGFVVMPELAEAEKAVAALNDKEILGRKMRVNIARHPDSKGARRD